MRATSQERWEAAEHNSLLSIYFTIIMHQYPKAKGHTLIFSICRSLRSKEQHKWKDPSLFNLVSKSWKAGKLLKSHMALRNKAKLFCVRERKDVVLGKTLATKNFLWKITLSVLTGLIFKKKFMLFVPADLLFKSFLHYSILKSIFSQALGVFWVWFFFWRGFFPCWRLYQVQADLEVHIWSLKSKCSAFYQTISEKGSSFHSQL